MGPLVKAGMVTGNNVFVKHMLIGALVCIRKSWALCGDTMRTRRARSHSYEPYIPL